jgi:hypothetical protein
VRSMHRSPLFTVHRTHPTDTTKRINKVIRFTIEIHPDGFVGVNFSFAASVHKHNTFGITANLKLTLIDIIKTS